ncbi:ABC transporter transmembrane domain-containing protein, partial [uncultured Mycobacterium sp.]|uniref:ABC transporter transmembrane domain-containing protein n=1 Tax=uncultured Mycobacterium sp. TaxID=171292 RepID=UPI0035C98036
MACGTVISGCAIASAIVLAHIVAGVITDPSSRSVPHWAPSLSILVALWMVRILARWVQARLGQQGASAVIADLSGQVLAATTARAPRQLAAQRDAAATVVTRGLDGLRPYFTGYLPALLVAAVLTPATIVAMAVCDLKSAVVALITLPLIPIFMVLIGLATTQRSAAALAAMTTLQARLLDLIAGLPPLRALGRAAGPEQRIAGLSA